MTKKEELFALIKSLSKAEKRYFRLFIKQADDSSNYLKLFEAMDTQHEYDESAIRRKFRKEVFCKQLHVTKNYLRQLILKSLRNFHSRISKDAELKDALRNAEILYHRELYRLCAAEIKRAETIARSFEINSGLTEVISWKRKLEQIMYPQNYKKFTELLSEQEKAIDAMNNTNLHWQHAVYTSLSAISNASPTDNTTRRIKRPSPEKTMTLEAKVLYYNAAYLSFLRNGLHDKAEQSLLELLELLEKVPHRIREDPSLYISSANNLVSYFVFSKQYEKALDLISRSRKLYDDAMQQHEKKSMLKQILRSYNMELEICRDKKSFENNLPFIEDTGTFITRHESKIPMDYLLSFWFQLANIHFMRKDFDQSLKWINRIMNQKAVNTRIDLQVHARILNLMIHLEQDNFFVLRYFVDSARRFMKKIRDVQPFEQVLLSFFSKIGQATRFEQKARFIELEQQLFSSKGELVPAQAIDYIDYRSWIAEKLQSK
jgi:hypothetical protein